MKRFLTKSVEVVTFVVGAFGGVFKVIAPPTTVAATFPLGITSFVMLIILMGISIAGPKKPNLAWFRVWLISGITFCVLAIAAAFLYSLSVDRFTYPHKSASVERRVCASPSYFTPDAQSQSAKFISQNTQPEDIVQDFPDGDTWTKEGIERSEDILLGSYMGLVLSIGTAIFCFLEASLILPKLL